MAAKKKSKDENPEPDPHKEIYTTRPLPVPLTLEEIQGFAKEAAEAEAEIARVTAEKMMKKFAARYRRVGANPFNPNWRVAAGNFQTRTVTLSDPEQILNVEELAREATPENWEFVDVREVSSSEAGITFVGPDGERKTLRVALAALAGDMPLGAGAISLEDAE